MTRIIRSGNGMFEVVVDGQIRGSFGLMLDANWYALALLKEGEVTSVTLVSGLEIR